MSSENPSGEKLASRLLKALAGTGSPLRKPVITLGVKWLERHPLELSAQLGQRPYSTLLKILGFGDSSGRIKNIERLYEEFRVQLADLRDRETDPVGKKEANRLLNRLERDAGEIELLSYPIRGYLELTNYCNLRCPMCGQSYFEDFSGPRKHLSPDAFSEIEKVLPFLDELVVSGFGESLVSPHFWRFMELLPGGGLVRLITNGVLLDKNASERLMKYPVNRYNISIEATDPETYREIRSADHFERVVRNIKDLNTARREAGRQDIRISLSFVAMQRNIEQLPQFVRSAREYGADEVLVSFLHVIRPDLIEQSLYLEPEKAREFFGKAQEAAAEVGIDFQCPRDFHPHPGDPARSRRIRDCYEPWEFIYFASTGTIRPCCIYSKAMGKLGEKSLEEIWNGKVYQSLRQSVNSEQPEPYCAKCWMVTQIDHNDRRYHINLVDKHGVYLDEDEVDLGNWK